jgi:hypothetical protein
MEPEASECVSALLEWIPIMNGANRRPLMNASVVNGGVGFLIGVLALLNSSCVESTPRGSDVRLKHSTEATEAWYERSLVGMEVGPTGAQFGHSDAKDTRYCAKFDGHQIVRRCLSANCDYLVIWARDWPAPQKLCQFELEGIR